jgi:exosortase/archaeosortase
MEFYDAHNIYAKILSLVMMIFLTWVLFELLPELQEDMMGLFDLTKRVKKGMMVDGRLDLKYIEKKK